MPQARISILQIIFPPGVNQRKYGKYEELTNDKPTANIHKTAEAIFGYGWWKVQYGGNEDDSIRRWQVEGGRREQKA